MKKPNLLQRLMLAVFWNQYDAAQTSITRSYRSAPLTDAKVDLTKGTRKVLQGRSRDFERNSPLYTKLADTWEQYTVGTGIQLTSASSDPVWNVAADVIWERWKPVADLQSRFGFDNLQGIISRSLFVDGEVFVILTRENAYPRIQLVEAHRCETPPSRAPMEGISIVDGVEIDSNGRPTGYWFSYGSDNFRLVSADNVIHVFEPGRPGQYRGIPYITAALNVLHDREDLRLLEMRAAKDAAELSTIIYSASGEMPPGLGSLAQKFGSVATASGTDGSVMETRRQYYQTAVGGRTVVAQTGDKVDQHVPERPGSNTREYWRLLDADVCAAAGIPIALVYPDSMQGTVYRGALDAAAAHFRGKTAVLASYFRRIRNYVIGVEATYNRVIAKLPEDWRKTSNGTVRAPNVDIGRNSAAIINELAAGLRTWTSIASELGLDGKQLLKEKADELVYIAQLAQDRGITPESIASAQITAAVDQTPDQQAAV